MKPENILLTRGGHIKISDFGLSAIIDPVREEKITNQEYIGTPLYMAPEVNLETVDLKEFVSATKRWLSPVKNQVSKSAYRVAAWSISILFQSGTHFRTTVQNVARKIGQGSNKDSQIRSC